MNCCQQRASSGHHFDSPGGLTRFWNSVEQKQLRKDLLEGRRPETCASCWIVEKAAMSSKRQHEMNYTPAAGIGEDEVLRRVEISRQREGFNEFLPTYLDFKPGNKCNLKCRMCVPENSHLLHKEIVEHSEEYGGLRSYYAYGLSEKNRSNWAKNLKSGEILSMSSALRRLNISGGEPLLNPIVEDYISGLVERGYSQNIHLTFNTNGLLKNDRLFRLFAEFEKTQVYISVDGTAGVYEYIRSLASWEKLEKNVDEFLEFSRPNVQMIASPTLQILNALSYTEIVEWAISKGMSAHCGDLVLFPEFQSAQILPDRAKTAAQVKLMNSKELQEKNKAFFPADEIAAYLAAELKDADSYRKTFVEHTRVTDRIRGQELKASCPELYGYIHEWFE